MTWSKAAATAVLVGFSWLAGDALANGVHYFFGGSGNTRIEFLTGAAYMGPGNGHFVGSAGDEDGAQRMAVPIVLGEGTAIATNFTAALGGQPGVNKGMVFGVCVTRAAENECGPAGTVCSTASGPGSGVSCQVSGTDIECADETGYLAVCHRDRLMVKATRIGAEEPDAQRPKWSFQVVTFADGEPTPTPTDSIPEPTATQPAPTATPTAPGPTPTRTPRFQRTPIFGS